MRGPGTHKDPDDTDVSATNVTGTLSTMAALDDSAIQQEITCGICREIYENPKYVGTCHHTYCLECIDGVIQSNETSRVFRCPECRKSYPIPLRKAAGLEDNFQIASVIEALRRPKSKRSAQDFDQDSPLGESGKRRARKTQSAVPSCRICVIDTDASGYCERCSYGMYLCARCATKHKNNPLTAEHKFVELAAVCVPHDELFKAYCRTCSRRICHVCLLSDHSEHDNEDLDRFLESKKVELKRSLVESSVLKSQLETGNLAIRALESDVKAASKREKEAREREVSELQGKRKAIEEQIAVLEGNKRKIDRVIRNLGEAGNDWDWKTAQLQTMSEDIETVTKNLSAAQKKALDMCLSDRPSVREADNLIEVTNNIRKLIEDAQESQKTANKIEQQLSSAMSKKARIGTVVGFLPVPGTTTELQNGVSRQITTRHQCIVAMQEYESKSLEELRFEDYQMNRKCSPFSNLANGFLDLGFSEAVADVTVVELN